MIREPFGVGRNTGPPLAAAAPRHVGSINEVSVVDRVDGAHATGEERQCRFEVIERRESKPADFDAFGDLGAFGGAYEVNTGLGNRGLMTAKMEASESGRSLKRMSNASLLPDEP